MVSEKRLQRRRYRKRQFRLDQGPYAVSHDPRTWAKNNGGVPINHGEAVLLKMYPDATNVKQARNRSVLASKEEE